jgi:DNA polymerase
MILFLDTETYSTVPITSGLARYSTAVEVMIVTWAVDDGPVQVWDVTAGSPMPNDLAFAADLCDRVVAHNAQFDRRMIDVDQRALGMLLEGKWYCTMAAAYRHGLPGGLDKLCQVFKIDSDQAKRSGRELIHLFCKLQKDGTRATYKSHHRQWREFIAYAKADISAMREVYRKLPKWNDTPGELALWNLDQAINERGFAVDVEFATAALRVTKAEQKRLGDRTEALTDATVMRATQRDLLLRYLFVEHGINLPDLKADTVERRLNDPELPDYVKEVLRIRQQASKSSTSKYRRLLELQVGGRLYNTLQYRGAYRTGRQAGRDFQPQNLPRPKLKFPAILEAIEAFKADAAELVVDDIMEAASSAIRSTIVSGPGRKLAVSDLANIEGRKLAWLAGEEWKLDAFRAFDAGTGPDLYKVAYARSFGVDPATVADDSDERQIGKVQELALGYAGGVAAYSSMAAVYRLDLDAMAAKAWPAIPQETLLDARETYQWAKAKKRTLGLSERAYVACEALKRMWRDAHPATVGLWSALETACRRAISNPGREFPAGPHLVVDRRGAWLRIRLPSGRFLLYPNPRIYGPRDEIQFAAWNVYTKAWAHETTYGGKLAENVTQAAAADVLAHGMLLAEASAYPVVLTVHDEIVSEPTDAPEFSADGLSKVLATVPEWAPGLPLAAKGFESYRYRKG